jgi:hypothetical protein
VIKNEGVQENMTKKKRLTKRQLAVIEDVFSDFSMVDEQAVLDKHKVSRNLYNKWLTEASFTEQFDQRIAAAHRQSAALIARYAPLAAAKLVQLTDSDKEETARKACLDIISMLQIARTCNNASADANLKSQITPQLSDQTVSRLLAILAEEKND